MVNNSHSEQERVLDAGIASTSEVANGLTLAVISYIQEINLFDLDKLLTVLVNSIHVNDQPTDYSRKQPVAAWAFCENIGEQLKLKVVQFLSHDRHAIVAAYVSGLFDKYGIPDILVLNFYFSIYCKNIVNFFKNRNYILYDRNIQ